MADRYYARYLETYPETAYFSDIAIDRHDGATSNNLSDIKAWENFQDAIYADLLKVREQDLGERVSRISYWTLKEALESSIAMRVCKRHLWDVSHLYGWQDGWAMLAEFQPVHSRELRLQAIERWNKLPNFVATEIGNLRTGLSQGYSMPKEIVSLVIEQLQVLLDYEIDDSPYMSPAKRSENKAYYAEWKALVTKKVLPAIRDYQNFLKDFYLQAAREEISILNLPRGDACYQAYIRNYTTTNKTGIEIFDSGKQIVGKNKSDVIELGKQEYGVSDFSKIIKRLNEDSTDYFKTSEEILKTNNSLLDKARNISRDWFAVLPSSEVIIKPYEAHEGGQGSYEGAKGTKPAYFRISLKEPAQQRKGSNERLTYHEAYPGHHLQIGVEKDIKGLHPLSKLSFFGSYVEGWARYSERLAEEMGLYENLSALIEIRAWPARGMVVDPGLHLQGWTKEQAIAYMMESGRDRVTAESIYRRVIIWPAQLTSYDVGGEEIKALRKLAEERLGNKFDIRTFHSKILENGSIPLSALRTTIENWLENIETKLR